MAAGHVSRVCAGPADIGDPMGDARVAATAACECPGLWGQVEAGWCLSSGYFQLEDAPSRHTVNRSSLRMTLWLVYTQRTGRSTPSELASLHPGNGPYPANWPVYTQESRLGLLGRPAPWHQAPGLFVPASRSGWALALGASVAQARGGGCVSGVPPQQPPALSPSQRHGLSFL